MSFNLRAQMVERIRAAIIEGTLRSGDHIVESALSKQFSVSRTPIREALILLESEGLVTLSRHRGAFVRVFSPQDVGEIFGMRTALENFAAGLVIHRLTPEDFDQLRALIDDQRQGLDCDDLRRARRLDMDFHRYLVRRSENRLLIRSWEMIVAQIAALLHLRADAFADYDEYLALTEHTEILKAYEDRNLGAVTATNTVINLRVAEECRRAVAQR